MSIEVHEAVHIKIAKPITFRKKILESAIDSTRVLQRFEYFKAVRDKKEFYRKQFKSTIKEISNLINTLSIKELPEAEVKGEKQLKQKEKIEKPLPTVERLDVELMKIQEKLKNLEI